MKNTFTQVVLPLLLVALVIGGLTFVTNYTVTPKSLPPAPTPSTAPPPPAPLLYRDGTPLVTAGSVPTIRVHWDADNPNFVADSEALGKNHYNLWFENPHRQPVTVTLEAKSCQCAEVSVFTLPSGAREQTVQSLGLGGLLTSADQPDLLRPLGLAYLNRMLTGETWQVLSEKTHAPITIAAATEAGPTVGVIRLTWDGKDQSGPKLMAAELQTTVAGQPAAAVRVEVPTNLVPVLQTVTPSVDFGDLAESITTRRSFIVYSTTRVYVPVQTQIEPPHECVRVADVRALSADECAELSRRLQKPDGDRPPPRVLSAYEVTVQIQSGMGGAQLDLGLLTHRIRVVHPQLEAIVADTIIVGLVRGDVRVLNSGDDRERLMLGNFPINRGVKKTVTLTTIRPGLKLTLKEAESTPLVKATLTPSEDGKQWKLALEVPPNKFAGDLPTESVIVLETNDTPPRRIRLPVRGAAVSR